MTRSIFETAVGSTGAVYGASFSRRCRYLSVLSSRGELMVRGHEHEMGQVILPLHNQQVENFEFRDYLGSPDTKDVRTEVAYTRNMPSHVLRWSMDRRELEEPLELICPGVPVTSLFSSSDGRFLAAGNRVGVIEVWNFDFARPERIFAWQAPSRAAILTARFDRTNLRLYAVTSAGEILLVEPQRDDVTLLSRYSRAFQPLVVACHPKSKGWVLSGTASWLFMLDCPGLTGYGIPMDSLNVLPFQCTTGTNPGGGPCYWLSYLPHSKLRAMDPSFKKVMNVTFLDDGGLAVIGTRQVEVWDLDPLTRSCATKSGRRPLAVGNDNENVHVAVTMD